MDKKQVVDYIVDWVRQKVQDAGLKHAVLGLSGGIDSALVAALCKRALGDDAVIGVIMPCHSNPQDRADALRMANLLGIETIEVTLDDVFDALLRILPPGDDLARANLKPRLRMLTLYYIANSRGGLVVGTGNRDEIAVGYFTKYGDGGVDILPIGSLSKRQVRQVADFLGVPEDIIEKPPSAGLWPGQTDEDEMGITYDQLDAAVAVLEGDTTVQVESGILDKVRQMHAASAHKRELPPICPVPLEE
jgi:NAD+ synthase